jgi:hypothetical protein
MATRSMRKESLEPLAGELQGIDRVFGRDVRSQGWVVDLTCIGADAEDDDFDDSPDPAIIWVMRGRRR